MRNSTFLRILLGAILLGISYGAVFYGGVALGRTQAEPEPASTAGVSAFPTPAAMPETITFTQEDVAEMRAQMEARFGGELPPGMKDMLDQFAEGGTIDLEAMGRGRPGLLPRMSGDNR